MTVYRRDTREETPFSRWVRRQPGLDSRQFQLSVTDNDLWVHRFSARSERFISPVAPVIEHIQLLEIKSFGADMPFAQKDTFDVINRMLRRVSVRKDGRRLPVRIPDSRFPGRWRQARWYGIHLVQLSTDDPETSDRIIWDGKLDIDKETLIDLIRFDRDPDHPSRFLDTRRHHVQPKCERPIPLFRDATP